MMNVFHQGLQIKPIPGEPEPKISPYQFLDAVFKDCEGQPDEACKARRYMANWHASELENGKRKGSKEGRCYLVRNRKLRCARWQELTKEDTMLMILRDCIENSETQQSIRFSLKWYFRFQVMVFQLPGSDPFLARTLGQQMFPVALLKSSNATGRSESYEYLIRGLVQLLMCAAQTNAARFSEQSIHTHLFANAILVAVRTLLILSAIILQPGKKWSGLHFQPEELRSDLMRRIAVYAQDAEIVKQAWIHGQITAAMVGSFSQFGQNSRCRYEFWASSISIGTDLGAMVIGVAPLGGSLGAIGQIAAKFGGDALRMRGRKIEHRLRDHAMAFELNQKELARIEEVLERLSHDPKLKQECERGIRWASINCRLAAKRHMENGALHGVKAIKSTAMH